MNISTLLLQQTLAQPKTAAIIERRWGRDLITTYADLEFAASRGVTLLLKQGLKPGDGVLVFYPLSAALYIVLGALFRAELTAMFLDPGVGRDHIERCCQIYPPKALIASPKAHLLRLTAPALRQIPIKFVVGFPLPGAVSWNAIRRCRPTAEIASCSAETPALITFTSGSTGEPKTALRTHGFLIQQYQVIAQHLQLTTGAVDLVTLPIFVLANLAAGMTSVIPTGNLRRLGAIAPRPILRQLQNNQPQRIVASPAFLQRLADYAISRNITLPGVRRIFSGGAPIMPRLIEQLQSLAPQADLHLVYGSTEAEPIATLNWTAQSRESRRQAVSAMLSGQGLLAGSPVPEIQLRILRHQWGTPIKPYTQTDFTVDCLPPGEAGEIVVSGAHVLQGYLYGKGDAETKFWVEDNVWHRTGDSGYLGEQGRLWLLGRCQARIQDDRGLLYPFPVECVAQHHPGIRRAALLPYQGKRILLVELRQSKGKSSLPELQQSLHWAELDTIQVCRKIPMDRRHNAKVDYSAVFRQIRRIFTQ
ncbi:MAG: AMP-binding protein [Leptolyngbyaceae cyanobacterium MO_188.B28]|nr:AMP-binding protein [Leptolyngbyaceae cyanobacterium MO_188.B28]